MAGAVDRRGFLTRLAATGLAAGVAPSFGALARADSDRIVVPFAPRPDQADADVFAAARRQFLFPASVTYCNTGTLGASPRPVVDAMNNGLERLERTLPDWPYFQADGEPLTGYQQLKDVRAMIGAFLNASADEIALTQNATMGMSFIANGLDLAAGDEVLSTDQEHSGGIGGWRLRAKRHGVVVKELPLLPALEGGPDGVVKLFADAITPRTKVIIFSEITSGFGISLPAKALCALAHAHGALAVVDGAQAIGQRKVDVADMGCDAYVASPHKWMLAPKGTGILFVKRSVQPRIWNTLASGGFDDESTGAFRFMHFGTGSVPVVEGLVAAFTFITSIGIERIERWDAMLTRRLRDGLAAITKARLSSPADPRFASAITTFAVAGHTGRELQDALWTRQIRVRAQGEPRGVRLSAHFYVSPADIDRVLAVVDGL